MKVQSLLTLATCAALLLTIAGCASRKASTLPMTVTEQTTFEQLRDTLIYKIKGTVPLATKDNWISVAATAPRDRGARNAAEADFAKWCQLNSGRVYTLADQNKPESVKQAERLSGKLAKLSNMGTDGTRSCDVQGATYILESDPVSFASGTQLAWLSPEELQTKSAPATAIIDQMLAKQAAAAEETRKKREQQNQAENQRIQDAKARKTAYLQKSSKGTQVVCTGRQSSGMNIANIWYICGNDQLTSWTFSEFSNYGWRVSSQTLVPVRTRNGDELDATVIFERAR